MQRRERELVGAQCACERVRAQRRHEVCASGGQPRLRSAEQLVTGEEDQVRARCEALLGHRLVPDAELRRVQQRARAEVVQEGHPMRRAHRCDVGQRRFVGEAGHAEVGAVHHQQRGGLLCDGALVVRCVGAIDGSYFHEPCAALHEHVRYPEATAYLARFPTRDDDLTTRSDRRKTEQHRSRVVVDGDRVLRAGQPAE